MMKENELKIKIQNLCNSEKNTYQTLKDYKERTYYFYFSLAFFITAFFLLITLSFFKFPYQSGIFVFLALFFGGFLWFQSLRCVLCEKPRWVEQLEQFVLSLVYFRSYFFREADISQGLLEDDSLYCKNCNLTKTQMNKYIGFLKRGAEINENTVRKVFIEK